MFSTAEKKLRELKKKILGLKLSKKAVEKNKPKGNNKKVC